MDGLSEWVSVRINYELASLRFPDMIPNESYSLDLIGGLKCDFFFTRAKGEQLN